MFRMMLRTFGVLAALAFVAGLLALAAETAAFAGNSSPAVVAEAG
jgi:hypothetical protein